MELVRTIALELAIGRLPGIALVALLFPGAPFSAWLGEGATSTLRGAQIRVAPSGRVAWALGDVLAVVPDGEGALSLPMRATWVLVKEDAGWRVVQTHASFPVSDASLAKRVFGE